MVNKKNLLRWAADCGVVDINNPLKEELDANFAPQLATDSSMIDSLARLKREVEDFDGCELKKTAINTVFARGDKESGLMIIGEAPGATEDAKGIPFCGASGQLLDQMLKAIRHPNAYITNMIFWRPDANRKPSDDEISACLPFVQRHIALIRPRILLLLGSTAANNLLDSRVNMTQMRMQMHNKPFSYLNDFMHEPVTTLVSYHPSYLLRQPLRKRDAWHDFLLLKVALSS